MPPGPVPAESQVVDGRRDIYHCPRKRSQRHDAGHILGSSQVRLEHQGRIWVVSGDYKRDLDPTCVPFEVLPCDVFISEATFALPMYRWTATEVVAADILSSRMSWKAIPALAYRMAAAGNSSISAARRRGDVGELLLDARNYYLSA